MKELTHTCDARLHPKFFPKFYPIFPMNRDFESTFYAIIRRAFFEYLRKALDDPIQRQKPSFQEFPKQH